MELFSFLTNVSFSQTMNTLPSLSSTFSIGTTISVSDVDQSNTVANPETAKANNHSQLHDQLVEHVTHSSSNTTTFAESKKPY